MEAGSVFIWENYPNANDKIIKPRWFVYFGEIRDDPFISGKGEIFTIAFTTTSKIDFYVKGGERFDKPHIRFKPREGFGFELECVLDLSFPPDSTSLQILRANINERNIKQKGVISKEKLRQIYYKILESKSLSRKLKQIIHNNLNAIGITGLPNP